MKEGIERRKNLRALLRIGVPGIWLICLPFVAGFLWILHKEAGISTYYTKAALWIGLSVSSISFFISYVVPRETSSVLLAHAVIGLMALAGLLLSSFFSLAYYFTGVHDIATRITFLTAIFASAIVWCRYCLLGLKRRMQERRFIEKEFRIEATHIVMRTPPKTNLDPDLIKPSSWKDKTGNWLFPKLVFLVPITYPLQRLFSDSGGLAAILLLLSILSLPLAIYIIGRITCGYYLWIRTIRKLECKHGKPVVFEQA
jgi:hypothetical protein